MTICRTVSIPLRCIKGHEILSAGVETVLAQEDAKRGFVGFEVGFKISARLAGGLEEVFLDIISRGAGPDGAQDFAGQNERHTTSDPPLKEPQEGNK